MPSKSPSRHSTYNSRGHRKIAPPKLGNCAASEDGCYDLQDVEKMPAMSSDLKLGIFEGARRMGEKKEKFDKDYANVCYIFRDEALHKNIELVGPSVSDSDRSAAEKEYLDRTSDVDKWADVYENSKEETMPQFCYLKEGNNIKKAHLRSYPGIDGYFVSGETAWFGGKKRKTKKQKKSKKQRKTKKQKKSKKARK